MSRIADGRQTFRLRLPREVYQDLTEIARLYDLSVNELLCRYVTNRRDAELTSPIVKEAIDKMRVAREVMQS